MVRRFTPLLLAALALSVANPLSAAPPAPAKPQEQSRPLAAKAPARPVGVWVRDVGPVKVVLKLTDDRLTATALFATGEEVCPVVRVTLDADYAVAKDGTLFGVIFGADANHPMYTAIFEPFEGHAFAFGWRVDGDNLTVRNLKCLGEGMRTERVGELANLRMLVGGRYTRIDESKLPAWEKKFSDAGSMVISALINAQLEEYRPKPPVPPPFPGRNEAPTAMPGVPSAMTAPPQPVVGVPPPPSVSVPAAPATTTTPPVVYADPAPAPQPLPVIAPPLDSRGATLPRRIAAPQPLPEVPPQTVPQSQPPTAAPSASLFGQPAPPLPASTLPHVPTSLLGTWTRDAGAFRATFKFTPKQLVVHMHVDPTGKKDLQEVIFIVEYKLTADGKRFEGTVIGADVKTGKEVAFIDADDTLRGAREVDDQPVRFEFRITEGLLLVRNVSFGADGKSCALLKLNLPGVYALETEKTGAVAGQFSPPPVTNSTAPREPDQNTHTTHVVEAPDILLIEVLKGVPKPAYQLEPLDVIRLELTDPVPMEPLQDSFTIDPDGTIDLGTTYGGRVKIAGLTVAEAKLAVEKSLAAAKLKAPKLTIRLAQLRSVQQINGQHLVRPDGTIGLGRYGSVSVMGKSLADAKRAVEKHLSQYLLAPEVSVEVQGFNNKTETPRGSVPTVPTPTSAKPVERPGCRVEARGPVPVLPPLREGALPDAPPPPCIHEVLKALPPAPRGIPLVFEVSRENIEQTAWVVKELEADKLDPPRFYPLVGIARLHHATWKCTVTFSETITSDFPFPFKTTHERVEVVRIPQLSLYRYVVPESPAAPSGEPTKVSNGSGSVVPAGGTAPANPLHGTWVREQDGMQVVLKFTEKRLNVEINATFAVPGEKGPPARFNQSLDADYSTSPDGTVFGILTGIDVTLGEGLPPETYASVKEARQKFAKATGTMFTFRTRLDGGRLTLSEPRASMFDSVRGPTGDVKSDARALVEGIFAGRFERVNGKVSPPKPTAGGIINQYSEDPNVRIEQLQKPKDEQQQKGTGLVPPPSTPAPKCKDCAPPLKLIPGGSEPVAPLPMSRG